jgi:hypothetical protein
MPGKRTLIGRKEELNGSNKSEASEYPFHTLGECIRRSTQMDWKSFNRLLKRQDL